MAASLDHISKGRLIFDAGAGYNKKEYIIYGVLYPKPGIRIRQLDEALTTIRIIWTEYSPSSEGKYYKINEAICNPKPFQKPYHGPSSGAETGGSQ